MNAIVTGCGKGIGKSIVLQLAQMNYNVLGCARTKSDLEALKAEFEQETKTAKFSYELVDLSKKEEVILFGKKALEQFEQVDVLVNNAGVFLPGSILDEPEGQLEAQISTNLYSAYYLCRTIVPNMKEAGQGQIINICSIASQIAYPSSGSYSISKFGMLALSKSLRSELKEHNIRVNAILPGATWSNSWQGVELPKERLMDATEIAKIVKLCIELKDNAVIEEIVIRPQLGDL